MPHRNESIEWRYTLDEPEITRSFRANGPLTETSYADYLGTPSLNRCAGPKKPVPSPKGNSYRDNRMLSSAGDARRQSMGCFRQAKESTEPVSPVGPSQNN